MPFPDICVEDRESCPNEWPTLFYAQNACSSQQVQLRDRHGEHYDLRNRRVFLIAKEGIDANLIRIAKVATIIDAQQGVVEIPLDQSDTTMPGLFIGEFIIEILAEASSAEESSAEDSSEHVFSISSEEPSAEEVSAEESSAEDSSMTEAESSLAEAESSLAEAESSLAEAESSLAAVAEPSLEEESSSWDTSSLVEVVADLCYIEAKLRCYVEIQEDLWHTDRQYHTLTIAELRLAIRDKCREDNFLLDNVEFSDTEIAWALRRPIDYWNEALPPLDVVYSTMNFPFIYNWTMGAVGELLAMAALHYERNRLRYTATGLSIDDKDKASFYQSAADRYRKDYADWVAERKRSMNMSTAFGSTSLRTFDNAWGYGRRY